MKFSDFYLTIRICVWQEDRRASKGTIVGQISVDIASLGTDSSQQWHPLLPPGQESYVGGDIHLKIVHRPQQKIVAVRVLDGRNLMARNKDGSSDPYLEVNFAGTVKKTEVIKATLNPLWNEEFLFHYVATPIYFIVTCYDWNLMGAHEFMGEFKVYLKDLKPEVANDIRYTEDRILPAGSYDMMFRTLFTQEGIETMKALGQAISSSEDRVDLADNVINAYEAGTGAVPLFQHLLETEIKGTEDPRVIFRGNSLGTKALDLYMKLVGSHYLSFVLGPFISQVYALKKSCEVDPSQIDSGEDVNKNSSRLLTLIQQVLDAIFKSVELCPTSLRCIFKHIQLTVKEKFPDDDKVQYSAVSGFIFLRFFCAAILSPKLFGLAPDHPEPLTGRSLKLIAKAVQNAANLVLFEAKEPYLKVVNPLIECNLPSMKGFIDAISVPPVGYKREHPVSMTPNSLRRPKVGSQRFPQVPTNVIETPDRELASIHRHLLNHKEKIINAYPPKIFTWCNQTIAMLDDLEMSNLLLEFKQTTPSALPNEAPRLSVPYELPKANFNINLSTNQIKKI